MQDDTDCDDNKLVAFSRKHFTYINQFFGNEGVRDIIMETYPVTRYTLAVEEGEGEFVGTHHHVVYDNENQKTICSVDQKNQNPSIDRHDTLCQTYSLLTYLNFKFPGKYTLPPPKSLGYKREKQFVMIRMYKDLLADRDLVIRFINELDYPNEWCLNFYKSDRGLKFKSRITTERWLQIVEAILKEWEKYGFHFFMNDGDCPKRKCSPDDSKCKRARSVGGMTRKKRKFKRTTRKKYYNYNT